jgi:hypothetical protein
VLRCDEEDEIGDENDDGRAENDEEDEIGDENDDDSWTEEDYAGERWRRFLAGEDEIDGLSEEGASTEEDEEDEEDSWRSEEDWLTQEELDRVWGPQSEASIYAEKAEEAAAVAAVKAFEAEKAEEAAAVAAVKAYISRC